MAYMNEAPCRVSADLRAKQHREDQFVPIEFDWTNEDHVRAIFTKEQQALLVKPIMALLDCYHYIDQVQRSFGDQAFNKDLAIQMLMADLLRLREGCAIIFAEER